MSVNFAFSLFLLGKIFDFFELRRSRSVENLIACRMARLIIVCSTGPMSEATLKIEANVGSFFKRSRTNC